MDILIPDNWLRDFLKTSATVKQIADSLSLSGPSIDRITKTGYGPVYLVDLTTNRPDSASVYGIAKEAVAILPRFKIKALLQSIKVPKLNLSKDVKYLGVSVDHNLCSRFTAVLIKNVKIKDSPSWMKERLNAVGVRPINNVVDISNYILHELGQPVHTFDYDKIGGAKMILRESKKGEKLTTLDGKTHSLLGGDIVIEDGKGRLIDLAGIMGAENSAVDKNTKNVLLFVQTYNPANIRRTSMGLAHRTEAAVLFEKGLDPELVTLAIAKGIELFEKLTQGKAEKRILDLYPSPYKTKIVETDINFITERLGVRLRKSEVSKTLNSLGFEVVWKGKSLSVSIPSSRAGDIEIPEDIVEEVARIYGYHNLPSHIMTGSIPEPPNNSPFDFEIKIKRILKGYGAVEVYTSSLVSKDYIDGDELRLKNPLGSDSLYLRSSMRASLVSAIKENSGELETFHLFEIANVYIPKKDDLPSEIMTLAGAFTNTDYRGAKGQIEALLSELNASFVFYEEEGQGFMPGKRLAIKSGGKAVGELGILENEIIYYEFAVEKLRQAAKDIGTYQPIPKYPAQIEDITLKFPEKTKIGEIISYSLHSNKLISNMELTDIYKDSYTFRIWYQDPKKTLTDKEVLGVREKLLTGLKKEFGAIQKI